MYVFIMNEFLPFSFYSVNRVRPLPSLDWTDIASEFFCHAHSHSPRLPSLSGGDILVGESMIQTRLASLIAVYHTVDKVGYKKMVM